MNARHTSIGFVCAALGGLALGACFTGQDARGLPCTADVHCGLGQQCIDGYCAGVYACPEGTEIPAEAVCDGVFDCEDGNDEHPEVCGTDAFFCDDGTTIALDKVCDGMPQCPDASDEAADLCILDQCADPSETFAFSEVLPLDGIPDALGVFPANLVGDSPKELVLAGFEGSLVRVIEFGMTGPIQYELPGDNDANDPAPNFTSPIVDIIPYDFDLNGRDDLIVRTSDHKLYGYIGVEAGLQPEQLFFLDAMGDLQPFYQVPFPIVDIALGKLNADSFVDLVVATEGGFIFTALGDPESVDTNAAPFAFSLTSATMVPDVVSVDLIDIDDAGLDELIVFSGTGGGGSGGVGTLTLGRVKDGGGLMDFWQLDEGGTLPFVPNVVSAGFADQSPGIDLAVMRNNGQLALLRQTAPGSFETDVELVDLGAPISGMVVEDFDCNGTQDLIVNVASPPSVEVLFVSNMGEIDAERSLTIDSEGVPRGRVAVVKLDEDASWDVFHAVDPGTTLDGSEVRGFLSTMLTGP
jgi:hypothetical protein